MAPRKLLFWSHLVVGVAAGGVILWMAATGMILATEPQVTAWAGRGSFVVGVPPGVPRLPLADLLARAGEEGLRPPSAVTVQADPAASVALSYGREKTVYADPYSGRLLGQGPQGVAAFYRTVEHLHRWFALSGAGRDIGKNVTGAAALSFVLLLSSGLYLWWPRGGAWKNALAYRWGKPGKVREWNWHTVTGFWISPVIAIIALTGCLMAYPWANGLLYTATRSVPPQRNERGGGNREGERGGPDAVPPNLDLLFAAAAAQAPGWRAITLNLPRADAAKATATIEEAGVLPPHARARLTLDAQTAAVVHWEPYAAQNAGRRLQGWVKPLHTGESFGLATELLALLGALGTLLLVWTGFSLSWRRFRARARTS